MYWVTVCKREILGITLTKRANGKGKTIEMVVCTVPVDDVVNTAISVLRTGEIGDGKIFISPVSRVIKVRTGEEDREALL